MMKYLKLSFVLVLLAALAVACKGTKAQQTEPASPVDVSSKIEARDFVFTAETAIPLRGGTRHLSGGYDLTIKAGRINAYLPFFGYGQTAPIGNTAPGVNFTSHNFTYNVVRNKSGWSISIQTNDVPDVREVFLTVYEAGSARLDVRNRDRDDISYRGYIK